MIDPNYEYHPRQKKRSRGVALHENVVEPFISDTQDP